MISIGLWERGRKREGVGETKKMDRVSAKRERNGGERGREKGVDKMKIHVLYFQ